jgi:hypothetical protein
VAIWSSKKVVAGNRVIPSLLTRLQSHQIRTQHFSLLPSAAPSRFEDPAKDQKDFEAQSDPTMIASFAPFWQKNLINPPSCPTRNHFISSAIASNSGFVSPLKAGHYDSNPFATSSLYEGFRVNSISGYYAN